MRGWVVALLLFGLSAPAAAVGIDSYDVVLRIAADGSAAGSGTFTIGGAAPGTVAIPLGFERIGNLRLTAAPPGTQLSQAPLNGQTLVRVELPAGAPAAATVSIAFSVEEAFLPSTPAPGERSTLPSGSRLLRHAVVNSQTATIRNVRVEVLFPDGMRAHAIREALPKAGRKEIEPRVRLCEIDDAAAARLRVAALRQGDAASMQIELVPVAHSPGWLIAGVLLSALYLRYFRDLVAPPKAGTQGAPTGARS